MPPAAVWLHLPWRPSDSFWRSQPHGTCDRFRINQKKHQHLVGRLPLCPQQESLPTPMYGRWFIFLSLLTLTAAVLVLAGAGT